VVLAAAILAAFSVFAVNLAYDVAAMRAHVETRVHWLIDIHTVEDALQAGEVPQPLPLDAMEQGLADQPAALVHVQALRENTGDAEALRGLVPAIRRQTAATSQALGDRWAQLDALVLGTTVLSILTLLLLLRTRWQARRLTEELALRADLEQARSVEEQRLSLLGAGLLVTNEALEVLYASASLEVLRFKWPSTEAWWAAVLSDSPSPQSGTCDVCGKSERHGAVSVALTAPGSDHEQWFELAFGGHGHDVGGEVVLVRDVTERVALEGRLMVADRLSSVGTMAASVVHEINNPLTWILGSLDLLRTQVAQGQPADPELIRDALDGVARVQTITADLHSLGNLSHGGDTEVNLADVIASAARLGGVQLRGRGQLVMEVALDLPPIRGSAPRLGQVLLNLLVNAAQALPHDDHRKVILRAFPSEGGVMVEVEDNGPGITPSMLPFLFQPFATTKDDGRGLGLYVCQYIVVAHDGRLTAKSDPGGTVMQMWLPAAPQGALQEEASA
jgi:C4-dicarboxylate-specific signal transduction histidine kinase